MLKKLGIFFVALLAAAACIVAGSLYLFPQGDSAGGGSVIADSEKRTPTRIVEDGLSDVSSDIQFHVRMDGDNPVDFFHAAPVSDEPVQMYVRDEYIGLEPGREYSWIVRVYDPNGKLVASTESAKQDFTSSLDRGGYHAIYVGFRALLNRPGRWRVESVLTDTESDRRLILSRGLPVVDG